MASRPTSAAFFCVTIDPEHDIAGFVLDWIRGLATQVERVEVIALEVVDEVGANLPDNVRVTSLGKERGYGRGRILLNAQRAVVRAMSRADFLLCHMMPIYVLASAPICRLKRKPLLLWYTHQNIDLKLRLAVQAADLVLTAVPESMGLATPKKRAIGHGINIARFNGQRAEETTGPLRVISVGRLSPVKRVEVLIEAAAILKEKGRLDDIRFVLVGGVTTGAHADYAAGIRKSVADRGLAGAFEFLGSVPFARIAEEYHRADLFISAQEQRGLDKVGLEAMAAGVPALVANKSYAEILGREAERLLYPPDDPAELAERLAGLADTGRAELGRLGRILKKRVTAAHSLDRLMERILTEVAALA